MNAQKILSCSQNTSVNDMSFAALPPEIDSENMQIGNCFRRLAFASALVCSAAFIGAGICTIVPGAQLAGASLFIAGCVCAAVAIVFTLISCGMASIDNQSRLIHSYIESTGDLTEEDVFEEEDLSEVSYRLLTKEENEEVNTQYQQIVESNETDLGDFLQLPKEIVQIIITLFKRNLHEMALVCKAWKIISYSVHRDIFPFDTIFGVQAYETLTVKAAGRIPPLPLSANQALEEDKEISLIAKAIIRIHEDGTDGKVEILSSRLFLELTGGLTNKGHKIELHPNSMQGPLDAEEPPSKSYWLCRGTKTISGDQSLAALKKAAKDEKSYITNLREILISVGGNYALNGKKSPIFDETNGMRTWIVVSDLFDDEIRYGRDIDVGFYPAQDGESPARLRLDKGLCDDPNMFGVVSAQKSIDT